MAIIYDYRAYHAARRLKTCSQQARDVVCQLNDYEGSLAKFSASLSSIQDIQRGLRSKLSSYIFELEKTKEFARICSAACDLNSLAQMVKKRDQIICDRPKKRASD